jgi:23S rRNA (uracil1939-C5)-methyltransferase
MTMFAKNQTFSSVTIEDTNNFGCGVAHLDGMTVFVKGAVDGDVVNLKIIKVASGYLVATATEILTFSPFRTDPLCPIEKRCGSCVYRSITYAHELELKRKYVQNALHKVGLELPVGEVLFGKESGYRNKVQYPIGEKGVLGYFAEKTHEIVPCTDCLLQNPAFTPILQECSAFFEQKQLPAYDEKSGKGLLRHLCLRSASEAAGGEISVCLVINGSHLPYEKEFCSRLIGKFPKIVSITLCKNTKNSNVILGDELILLWGKKTITDKLCGVSFEISPLSFYQVNHDMAEILYQKAAQLADLQAGDTLCDLFCGVGTIGLSIAAGKENISLIGIEINPQSVESAVENAKKAGIQANFFCGDANHPALQDADVVLLDPPRKGCDLALIDRLAEIAPQKIVYISCNPDTLARDLSRFVQKGWLISEVTPVDLFPRTGHVETVCLMSRKDK